MNITLIITDQQRHDTIGAINPEIKTPNIDQLINDGVYFTKAYCQSPQCQPSRASLFTGRYPTAHKLWWNGINLDRNELTIGNYLSRLGYVCSFFGKDHFYVDQDKLKLRQFGFLGPNYTLSDWMRDHPNQFKRLKMLMSRPYWTGAYAEKQGHPDRVVSIKAVEWLRTKTSEPKFTVISFHGPHPPYAAPPPFSQAYKIKQIGRAGAVSEFGHYMTDQNWNQLISQYYGSISFIDLQIQQIVEASNKDDMIIFTSDHGDMLGDHLQFSKGLFGFDGVTRVPLIIRHPKIGVGQFNNVVQHIDILPTILEILGEKRPLAVQGRSLLRAVNNNHPIREYALSMIGHQARVRSIATNKHKYWVCGSKEYLFNLDRDPKEEMNLILSPNSLLIKNKMQSLLIKALIEAEDPLPIPLENM